MIHSVRIHGFRGYSDTAFHFDKYTCIIGGNGSGKTHILEAIHLASTGTMHYIQAPRYENSLFELEYRGTVGIKKYSRERRERKDIYHIQGSVASGIKYTQDLPYRTVFVSPFDMNLFYFAPGIRRDMLDDILERAFGQFRKIRKEYTEVMRQRNALLKKIREGEGVREDLMYWNKLFAEKAYLYELYRLKWRNFVDENMEYIQSLLPQYHISHTYTSKTDDKSKEYGKNTEDTILTYLIENTERDILTGHTHIGPHLDDFFFGIQTEAEELINSSMFLSRGENKILLLGLKQIEILFLRKYVDLPIILLFDDIFAELDFSYAEELIKSFEAEQVIVTSQRPLPDGENWERFSCIQLNSGYHAKN